MEVGLTMLIGEIMFVIILVIISIIGIGGLYYICVTIGIDEIRDGEKILGYFLLFFPIFLTLMAISTILVVMGV